MCRTVPSNSTSSAAFLSDGEGHRVEQFTSGGSGNHTYYLPGNVEEVTPSGALVKYYAAGGLALGENTARDASRRLRHCWQISLSISVLPMANLSPGPPPFQVCLGYLSSLPTLRCRVHVIN